MALSTDVQAFPVHLARPAANDPATLEIRWARAHRRLSAELADYRDLRGWAAPGDSVWVAAQLRVAEARRRCHELAEELEALLELLD